MRLIPSEAGHDATVLIRARAIRAFGDGYIAVLLPVYLTTLNYSSFQVGAVATATLVGSALLTLFVGFVAYRVKRRRVLTYATLLMAATGVAFASIDQFWPLLVIAFVGTLNPSGGDVSVFLPIEQSLLPQTVPPRRRTALFARYGLVGTLAGAIGALSAGLPEILARNSSLISLETALKGMFIVYAGLGVAAFLVYRGLSASLEPENAPPAAPLGKSKKTVYTLAALFSLDSFAGGFVIQALVALYLFERFELSVATTGLVFFWTNMLAAFSILASARLADRIGMVEAMVFTHAPAQIALILVPFMPTLPLALTLLLVRSAFSHMDVAPRNSYVMAVVSPEERSAAASLTSVPRSLAAAGSPLLAGWLFGLSPFGWPFVIGGGLKLVYDALLLGMFRRVRPPEE